MNPTGKVLSKGRGQTMRIPKILRLGTSRDIVHRKGDALLQKPASEWPKGYFEALARPGPKIRRLSQSD